MKDVLTRTPVGIDSGLFQRLKEIADRRRCAVDDLVDESVKARYSLYSAEERRAAVKALAAMDLPVGTWEEMEEV
jgi:hypothetical protein